MLYPHGVEQAFMLCLRPLVKKIREISDSAIVLIGRDVGIG